MSKQQTIPSTTHGLVLDQPLSWTVIPVEEGPQRLVRPTSLPRGQTRPVENVLRGMMSQYIVVTQHRVPVPI